MCSSLNHGASEASCDMPRAKEDRQADNVFPVIHTINSTVAVSEHILQQMSSIRCKVALSVILCKNAPVKSA